MTRVLGTMAVLAVISTAAPACEEARCRALSARVVDEGRYCVGPEIAIPELEGCTPYPPTRGIRVLCLVDSDGQLYLASAGDSERLSGSGWRYSGGAGAQGLSAEDMQRCAEAIAQVGFPEPNKTCTP